MKKLFALILALTIIFSMVPFGVLATEPEAITIETEAPVMLADGDISSGTPDGTPPVLTGMTLSATTVTSPGEIEVTVSATDDVSGISVGYVYFYCEENWEELTCKLTNNYYDEKTGDGASAFDGELCGTIYIDQYTETSKFKLNQIVLYDIAGNRASYVTNADHVESEDLLMPDFVTQREISVESSETPDGTPPVLTGMTLSATTVTAPGEIEVTVSATDDVSGISVGYVYFYCEENWEELSCKLTNNYYDEKTGDGASAFDGELCGTIYIDQYTETSKFKLNQIVLYDIAGNRASYVTNADHVESEDLLMPDFVTQREISVESSETPDGTPPVLTGMTLSATTVTAPSEIEVTVSTTDDVSGISVGYVYFYCEENWEELSCKLTNNYYDEKTGDGASALDGELCGTIYIDQYTETSKFKLNQIVLYDIAGNRASYVTNADHVESEDLLMPDFVTQRAINVLNAIPDVTTSVAKPEFVEQVQDAADDAYIVADFSGETTMPEEVFDAIAGTNKTLDLVSEGVTWRFNGEDITEEIKPIDLNVEITKVEENDSETAQEIQNKLDETPGVVMKFAENGELPGKATIQVKVDYAMRQYLGTDQKLCVYYYNNQTGKLELVAENLTVLNDTYVEFTITHCSYYILTTELPPETPEEPDTPDTEDVTFGDTDGNGKIQTNDAKLVLQHIVRMPVTLNLDAADVDGNGKIQTNDAKLILQYIVKIITQFPAEKAESSDSWGENQTPPAIRG